MENSRGYCVLLLSPPSRRSGLKLVVNPMPVVAHKEVSALAAEWIEIDNDMSENADNKVSALAAEWIEIGQDCNNHRPKEVSALAAEWIEI